MTDLATTWHDAMRTAATLDPNAIAAQINASADSGLRATRYDSTGGRTTFVACDEPGRCDDGPGDHSHMVTSDPTGNAAVNSRGSDDPNGDQRDLTSAHSSFVAAANVVLDFVSGQTASTWQGVTAINSELMPGTVQAGLDVDHERLLPRAINRVSVAVLTVQNITKRHGSRSPSTDEQHWTAGLADEDCCVWHLTIHRRYRRPRLPGKNICQSCCEVTQVGGERPPDWLLEAEVDRESKPKAWHAALSRWLDELGTPAHQRSA